MGCELRPVTWFAPGADGALYVQARADTAFEPASRTASQDTSHPTGDTVAVIAAYFFFVLRVSDRQYREVIEERFGPRPAGAKEQ